MTTSQTNCMSAVQISIRMIYFCVHVCMCINRLLVMRNSGGAGLIEKHQKKNQSQMHMTKLWIVSDDCSLFDPGVQIEPLLRYEGDHNEAIVTIFFMTVNGVFSLSTSAITTSYTGECVICSSDFSDKKVHVGSLRSLAANTASRSLFREQGLREYPKTFSFIGSLDAA